MSAGSTPGSLHPPGRAQFVTTTRHAVHSVNTGALVCGPYDDEAGRTIARQECDRLNREALQCRTAPSEAHPSGQSLSWSGDPALLHQGEPQEYEVRSSELAV